ncbi:MAG: SAM-dependent methyltransferase [Planctomycetes bacterium]|nr:SAM-dependent methyltransferase [Planctomycetota bacterium]
MSLKFIKGLIQDPQKTGAIAPSSKGLAKELLRHWPAEKESVVVEYGSGTGAVTEEILKKIEERHFFAFELNQMFVDELVEKFPEREFICDSATLLPEILKQKNLDSVDLIVSGLPWANFPESLQKDLLAATIESMSAGGTFSTFAYVHALKLTKAKKFRELLETIFPKVELSPVVWKNLPPALVYHCHKAG